MVNFVNIPKELKTNASFCLWKLEKRSGKPTKVPYDNAGYMDYKIADLKFKPKRRRRPDNDKRNKNGNDDADLKALEALEKQE